MAFILPWRQKDTQGPLALHRTLEKFPTGALMESSALGYLISDPPCMSQICVLLFLMSGWSVSDLSHALYS